jgi:hypothetical protein
MFLDHKEVLTMPALTVKKVMQQRLTRGTPVIVADSCGDRELRGKRMIVASKATVKCNKGNRCAGYWCAGYAVFVKTAAAMKASPAKGRKKRAKQDMGWRGGSAKICVTHLKDKDGVLVLPPPAARQTRTKLTTESRLKDVVEAHDAEVEHAATSNGNGKTSEVTWADLSHAHASGNLEALGYMARALKAETERLKTKVISAQDKLLVHLTR